MSIIAQNTPPPAETSEIGSRISLSPRTAKVIASMAASAWLLGVQMEMDLSETVASSLAVGTIAAFSETFLRAEEAFQGDWYETRQINWDLL